MKSRDIGFNKNPHFNEVSLYILSSLLLCILCHNISNGRPYIIAPNLEYRSIFILKITEYFHSIIGCNKQYITYWKLIISCSKTSYHLQILYMKHMHFIQVLYYFGRHLLFHNFKLCSNDKKRTMLLDFMALAENPWN